MNNILSNSVIFGFCITIMTYWFGFILRKRYNYPIINPILVSVILIMLFIVVFDVDYEVYRQGSNYISSFLTPATVCLAIPLYQKIKLLRENVVAILLGVLTGVLASMFIVYGIAILFGLTSSEYVTLLPNSITSAIAIEMMAEYGGIINITVGVIIATGLFGNMTSDFILKLFRITNPIAKGIAIGTSSHAIGTARAIEMGEEEGAMASLAIVVTGLCTVVAMSIFYHMY